MGHYLLCLFIFRILLPILLSVCIIFRPTGLSFIYLLLLLCLPLLPVPTLTTMSGSTGIYLKCMIAISAITFLSQLTFHITLLSMPPYGEFIQNCTILEKALRHGGFVRLNNTDYITLLTWISPEVIMLLTSLASFLALRRIVNISLDLEDSGTNVEDEQKKQENGKHLRLLVALGRYVVLVTLCLAAVLRPSVIGGFYFLVFLTTATWWACYKQLRRGFAIFLRCLMVIVAVHMCGFYAYQFQWPQEFLHQEDSYARYFGLKAIFNVSCEDGNDPRVFNWVPQEIATYIFPVALFWLYFVCALESKGLLQPQVKTHLDTEKIGETTPLIRGGMGSSSDKYGSGKKTASIIQDSTGSVTITGGDNTEEIQMEQLEEEYKPSTLDKIIFVLETILQVIIKSSYIATNIIMMAWSIKYLSWITFVLLIWSNILWLVPNQRKSMLRCSPLLVAYAWFLLLSAYVYSLDLTDDELPSKVKGYNLWQIGFKKEPYLPCNPLIVKCLFTAMFWITLRQYMQERVAQRQSSALADMVAPLQVTVGTATGVSKEQEKSKKLMDKLGQNLKKFLTKFWIWVVAITLFAVAITGEKMTGFRICYMALFLFFILTFQLSFRFWRRMMFAFWLVVIVYSMIILVMVYTYQFENFPQYWTEYLRVDRQQQEDIGLEVFNVKQLFMRLFTPTFFVIITVIQLHYFHKDFMEISDPKNIVPVANVELENSSLQGGAAVEKAASEKEITISSSVKYDLSGVERFSSERFKEFLQDFLKLCHKAINLAYLFLELHMPKIVLFFAMLLCVYDHCACYMIIIVLIVLALTLGRSLQIFAIHSSAALVSFMLLARMVYQIKYIQPEKWNVVCVVNENDNTNRTVNNADWFGLLKVSQNNSLIHMLRWNITYIVVVTVWSVVLVRQYNYRISRGRPTSRVFFMFPKVTRSEADKNLRNMIKYLFNYGFYKFGVEVSLMATVALIGFRMDLYAIIYSIWLVALFAMPRESLAKIWIFYLFFIAVALVIQYFMVIGLPPSLCVILPWEWDHFYRKVQEWAFLLDYVSPPSAKKLICDFILLLFVSRQAVVFRIEKRYENQDYAGGSNKTIIHLAEDKTFVNPMPDFVTYVRSYLDVFKRGILMSFLWITLAIVFLAGTNRVNIFSLGYLVGAFVFLWQGSDLYLKPIPKILRSWNLLIGYNVSVIMIKAFLQILGCIYDEEMSAHFCWLKKLLGIGCVRKFYVPIIPGESLSKPACDVPREYIGLVWDGLCFGFLIMMRRIFHSYNFFHMINEIKASTILASRGAELIEELRVKQIMEKEEQEKKVLEKIKAKMDRIKATQQKIQGANFKDTTNHYVDSIFSRRPKYRRKPPKTYKAAIRSGDYYMFDVDDEELDLSDEEEKPEEDEALKHEEPTLGEVDQTKTVTILEKSEESEPKPSTSKDEELSDISEPRPPTLSQKIFQGLLFIWGFIQSCLISLTNFLNKRSKDYRYVMKVLTKEKKIIKEKTNYTDGFRAGSAQVWQPMHSYTTLLAQSRIGATVPETSDSEEKPSILSDEDSDTKALATPVPQSSQEDSHHSAIDELDMLDNTEMSSYDQPIYVRLLLAIWFTIMSRSEMLCYFIVFLNQIKSATFLSLPLPLMVFFWGTLTIPRPSKTFWVTMIAYTEIIVLVKCIFQFDMLDWNKSSAMYSNPFFDPPSIIGIERKNAYALWDLLLLLVIFFHRFMLKSLGLWKTSTTTVAVIGSGDYELSADGQLTPIHTSVKRTKSKSISLRHQTLIPIIARMRGYEDGNDHVDNAAVEHTLSEKSSKVTFSSKSEKDSSSAKESSSSSKSKPTRRSSDLQHLVEETDEADDPDTNRTDPGENSENVVSIESKEVARCGTVTEGVKRSFGKYFSSFKLFFKHLMDPTSRVADDVYSLMFLCDFFNFFVILIGYSAFGTQQGDEGVSSYLQDNRVPVLFLLMLILQFTLIIIDRGIFLRKNIFAKLVFQFTQIVLLHIWLFIIYPIITERKFNSVLPPQLYYMVKCFYLLLSAYQIRCGYPTRILGNFLCKGYTYVNMFLYRGFLLVPFLFELRTVMDWMWTDTSMTVFDWIKMEDIFSHIFLLKCTRHVEDEYPQPRGERKSPVIKYIMGGLILFFIVAVIWFPLVFFSLGNAVGKPNIPDDVSLELRIGPYEPVYQMTAQSNSIYSFSETEFKLLLETYKDDKTALSFISNYEAADIGAVKLSIDSANVWSISPPDRKRMVDEINSTNPVTVRLNYKVTHKTNKAEDSGIISDSVQVVLPPSTEKFPSLARENLLQMLLGVKSAQPAGLGYILPKFLKVTSKSTAKPIPQLMQSIERDENSRLYRPINLTLLHANTTNASIDQSWWRIMENTSDYNYITFLDKLPHKDPNAIIIYTFNDKVFSATLSIITAGGILGLYTLYFFLIFRMIRLSVLFIITHSIWLDDMPNVDRIFLLIHNVYIVREMRQYDLEEMLFAKLIFVMRSRELAIKLTRHFNDPYNPEFIYHRSSRRRSGHILERTVSFENHFGRIDEFPTEEIQTEETPTEENRTEETPAEEIQAEETPTEESQTEEN